MSHGGAGEDDAGVYGSSVEYMDMDQEDDPCPGVERLMYTKDTTQDSSAKKSHRSFAAECNPK